MEQEKPSHKLGIVILVVMVLVVGGFGLYGHATNFNHHNALATVSEPTESSPLSQSPQVQTPEVVPPPVTHITTPDPVTAVYASGWIAGTKSGMGHIFDLLSGNKLNAVVIDIKDATGRLSYEPLDPTLLASGVGTKRIANLPALISELHAKGVYVIGRIEVFQDPYYPTIHPEDALQSIKTGSPWKDPKGNLYLRADSPDVWHYTERIAEDAYAQGFDEINLDYVRFPSDGNLSDIDESTFTKDKEHTIEDFFADVDAHLRGQDHIPLSADIFGLTLSANDDMGIGQKLELIAPHVDYVCPMIYPSHFANGSYGYKNPAEHPYDIIHTSLTAGIAKLKAITIPETKLRPWLQDFNLGAIYTPDMVQAQITATNDVGIQSWLMWDPRNLYTSSVLK
ncbi:MAG TPA: putative glycoside hydrolase [Candidatus Paceibacterota bacterium]|jgi:hypothetical protein|nr:putative glycoside hydrolase [Candidatus Paceibacterota bacterium]